MRSDGPRRLLHGAFANQFAWGATPAHFVSRQPPSASRWTVIAALFWPDIRHRAHELAVIRRAQRGAMRARMHKRAMPPRPAAN